MSRTGMPSVMHTISGMSASAASMIASAANGGGTNITVALAPRGFAGLADGIEHRHCVEYSLATLSGGNPADNRRAVGERLLGVKHTDAAGNALNEETGVFVD